MSHTHEVFNQPVPLVGRNLFAVTPALRGNAAIAAEWGPKLAQRSYDARFAPASQKAGLTMGMGMTEKQGGSDVRANTTQARFDGRDAWGARYALVGHKWFFSAPMCDAFLVLAQAPAGLSWLMRNVLADLALESEAATVLSLRLARAFDRPGDAHEALMARIYREMPLNSIWEGAGNIMALDLLRALRKGGPMAEALMAELAPARGANAAFDRFAHALPQCVDDASAETDARRLAQDVALAVQAALLCQHSPDFVFDAFCRSRLGGDWGPAFGTLSAHIHFDSIIARAMPH